MAAICMMIAGMDTLTAVTAILSFSVKSLMLLIAGLSNVEPHWREHHAGHALHFIGATFGARPDRDYRGRPVGAEIDLPDRSPSFIAAGLESVMNTPLTSGSPAAFDCFSTSF